MVMGSNSKNVRHLKPQGARILPNLLRCRALEVHESTSLRALRLASPANLRAA